MLTRHMGEPNRRDPTQAEGLVETTANTLQTQHPGDPTLPGVTKKLDRLRGVSVFTEMLWVKKTSQRPQGSPWKPGMPEASGQTDRIF